jgi:hypothetical protein
MELSLGRFGDRRLEKGGPFCFAVLLRKAGMVCGSAGLVVVAPARSGLRGFFATTR